jgi:hypothetical protein
MISIQTNVPSIESPIDWILSQKERIAKGYYSFSELQVPGTKDAAERSVDGYLSEPYCSFGSFAISQSTKNNITHAPIRFGFRCPSYLASSFFSCVVATKRRISGVVLETLGKTRLVAKRYSLMSLRGWLT